MKLKKYNQYIKEDLTPMSGDIEDMTGELEGEIMGQDEIMADDTSTPPVDNMNDQEEEEGNDLEPTWNGEELLKHFADLMGMEVIENQVKVADNKVVTFPSETNAFLIATDGKRRNTKITDPQKLYDEEFKGHEHNQ